MSTLVRLSAIAVSALLALPASAVQRTFVASYGLDTNPCSISSPCRGFARALTQTDANGEVVVLDSAGYGAVTISQSVSIIAPEGVYAGISVFSGTGVSVDPGVAGKVVLRGLSINGQGGTRGILVSSGAEIHIERCTISNLSSIGIQVQGGTAVHVARSVVRGNTIGGISVVGAAGSVMLFVSDTQLQGNATGSVFGAINLAAGSATLDRVRSEGNASHGLMVSPGESTTVQAMVRDSVFSGNGDAGVQVFANQAGAVARVNIERSTAAKNIGNGFAVSAGTGSATLTVTSSFASGNSIGASAAGTAPGKLYVRDSTLTNNATGIAGFAPGVATSCQNNLVAENGVNLDNVTPGTCNQ